MEQNKQTQGVAREINRRDIKSRPNRVLWFFIVLILIVGLGAAGYYLYGKIFKNQAEIDDGFADSVRYIEISAEKAKEMLDSNKDLIILDISNNYINGHIPTAINIELKDLAENLSELDQNDDILIYGRFYMNSVEAAKILTDNNFNKVYRLRGEFDAWVSEGYDIETGEGSGMKKDSDNDGISDKEEEALGSDPHDPDTDKDGLLDGDEIKLGTDITNPDTDSDGFLDGDEVDDGYDPLSKPEDLQNKIRELEEIDLETVNMSNVEGTASRYMSKGNYYLEVSGILPKLEEKNKYIVFLINDNSGEKVRTGELIYVKDISSEEDDENNYAQYSLEYQTHLDYYDYYLVELDIQQEIDSVTIMRGEFQRSE